MKKIMLIILAFLLGLYVTLTYSSKDVEAFSMGNPNYECPGYYSKKR